MKKTKIFVSAYACEPDKGSEIGVGWHWIMEMSKKFEIWVLTRKKNKQNIENWIRDNQRKINVHFVYYDLPQWSTRWKKGMRGVRTYYWLWQKKTNRIVKKTMIENDIKVYHLLTYGNALWPASKYGMNQKFIWGPIGGTDTIEKEYSRFYGIKSRMLESIRRRIVNLLNLNIGYILRCKKANIILCKTEYMRNNIPLKYRDKAIVFTDVACDECTYTEQKKDDKKNINFLAVGKLDAWRGFDLLVEAFDKLYKDKNNICLTIIGDGIDKKRLKKIIEKKKSKEHIKLVNEVSRDEYLKYLMESEVIVNPSLKEGGVTFVMDSLSNGKPIICIDTKGYTNNLDRECAFILNKEKRVQLIEKMYEKMLIMLDDDVRKRMSQRALENSKEYNWNCKGKDIVKTIERVVQNET